MAHAVGLDALASAEAMLADLAAAGYASATAGAGCRTLGARRSPGRSPTIAPRWPRCREALRDEL